MTMKQALQILIRNAAANQAGAGCGLRVSITEKERIAVKEAIAKVWDRAFDYPLSANQFYNLGL